MNKNFTINNQGVAMEFNGLYCDIHNEYDLVSLFVDYKEKKLSLIFERNQQARTLAIVNTLRFEAIGIDYLSIDLNTLDIVNEYVEEIGYKRSNDFGVDYLLYDDTFIDTDHLVIYLGSKSLNENSKGMIRLHASTLNAFQDS